MGRHQRIIADEISKELEIPFRTGRRFLQRVLDLVADDIVFTGRIELRGLGTFAVKVRAAKETTHPGTGQRIIIPEKKAVAYRASVAIRRRLNAPAAADKPTRRRHDDTPAYSRKRRKKP